MRYPRYWQTSGSFSFFCKNIKLGQVTNHSYDPYRSPFFLVVGRIEDWQAVVNVTPQIVRLRINKFVHHSRNEIARVCYHECLEIVNIMTTHFQVLIWASHVGNNRNVSDDLENSVPCKRTNLSFILDTSKSHSHAPISSTLSANGLLACDTILYASSLISAMLLLQRIIFIREH